MDNKVSYTSEHTFNGEVFSVLLAESGLLPNEYRIEVSRDQKTITIFYLNTTMIDNIKAVHDNYFNVEQSVLDRPVVTPITRLEDVIAELANIAETQADETTKSMALAIKLLAELLKDYVTAS